MEADGGGVLCPDQAGSSAKSAARYGGSEFQRMMEGKTPAKVRAVIDDLMDPLRTVNRRAYGNVIRRSRAI